MKLSIIMPVYNVEKYIEKCLKSIINQNNNDYELIIVDDGSLDNSVDIAKKITNKRRNIKIYSKENGGLSDARNYGLSKATGDYITFIDSDDEIEYNYVDSIIKSIKKNNNPDFLLFGYYIDYIKDENLYNSETIIEKTSDLFLNNKKNKFSINNSSYIGYAWNKVYKYEIIKDNKLLFEKGLQYIEDIVFNNNYFNFANHISIIDQALYHYKQYSNTITLGKKINEAQFEYDIRAINCYKKISNKILFDSKNNLNKYIRSRFNWSIKLLLNNNRYDLIINYSDYIKNNKQIFNTNIKEKIFYNLIANKNYFLCKFLLRLRIFIKTAKRIIPIKLKYNIKYFLSKKNIPLMDFTKNNVYIFLSSNYGNLGDCLITRAQYKFLKDTFPKHSIVKIYSNETFNCIKTIKSNIKKDDIISFIGGGNFGDLYKDLEYNRQFVTKKLKKYKKIYFPQSIICTDGKKESFLKKYKRIYDSKNNLFIFRDKESYNVTNKIFKNSQICLLPDIVTYLKTNNIVKKNNKVLLCLRNDIEKNMEFDLSNLHETYNNYKIMYTDTQIKNNNMSEYVIDYEINKIFDLFLNSNLVVTDRLHGMIISYILNIPFIALDNNNNKISNYYYTWLKNSKGILIDSDKLNNDILSNMINKERIDTSENTKYDFNILKNILIEFLK